MLRTVFPTKHLDMFMLRVDNVENRDREFVLLIAGEVLHVESEKVNYRTEVVLSSY
jgi:hypothetical protein